MPRARRWDWFWGTPINDVLGRLFRFYGFTIGRVGFGILTYPAATEPKEQT